MSDKLNLLVTGGCGFIGSNFVKKMISDGHTVTVVDDLSTGDERLISDVRDSVHLMKQDFADDATLNAVLAGKFDTVVHFAAWARVSLSVQKPLETNLNNVDKSLKLLDACREARIKRFVFASSSSVYGGADLLPTPVDHPTCPKSPYALQKLVMEKYNQIYSDLYGLDTVSLRFFNVFGPGQLGGSPYNTAISAWLHAIKHGYPCRFDGTGEQSRDMTYVDNVVDCVALACEKRGRLEGSVFNVGCQSTTSNNQIMRTLVDRFGNSVMIDYAPFRAGDVMHTMADISETRRVLNYEPKVMFTEGLKRTIEWAMNSEIF